MFLSHLRSQNGLFIYEQMTLDKHMGLNCTGPLVHRFLSADTYTELHNQQMVESTDAEL